MLSGFSGNCLLSLTAFSKADLSWAMAGLLRGS
jgi:hypothetical protein